MGEMGVAMREPARKEIQVPNQHGTPKVGGPKTLGREQVT